MAHFPAYAEPVPGDSTQFLSSVAKECGVYLVGGEGVREGGREGGSGQGGGWGGECQRCDE